MSFYAGKYSGNIQCHITKGAHDISTMRGGVGSATVFHTDIKYLDYKQYSLTANDVGYGYLCNGTGYPDYESRSTVAYAYLPTEVKNYIIGGYTFSFMSGNTVIYTNKYNTFQFCSGLAESESFVEQYPTSGILWTDNLTLLAEKTDSGVKNLPNYGPDSTHIIPLFDRAYKANLSIIIWGMNTSGAFKPLTTQIDPNEEIHIDRTHFNVGGKDILSTKYFSSVAINNSDTRINSTGATFQLVNSVAKASGVEIISNNTETTLKKGGHRIISSLYGGNMVSMSSVYYKQYAEKWNAGDNKARWFESDFTITELHSDTTFVNGQVLMVCVYYPDAGYGQAQTTFCKFASGTFITLYTRTNTIYNESDIGTLIGSGSKIYYKYSHEYYASSFYGHVRRRVNIRVVKLS